VRVVELRVPHSERPEDALGGEIASDLPEARFTMTESRK
jgi:hypothetical protein